MGKFKYSIEDYLKVKSAFGCSFSPDGKIVAITSNLTGTQQIYLVSTEGGPLRQLTDYKDSVGIAAFSHTKDEMVFGMSVGGDENTQLYLLDVPTGAVAPLTNKYAHQFRFGSWSRDGKYISYSSNERNGIDFDVYVRDMQSGAVRMVLSIGGSCSPVGFSPRGAFLGVIKTHVFSVNNDLYLVSLADGAVSCVTSHEGNATYGGAAWMPDESKFFLITDEGKEYNGLASYDMRTKKREYILTPNTDVLSAVITRDGAYLAVVAQRETHNETVVYATEAFTPVSSKTLPVGMIGGIRWSPDGRHMLFNFYDDMRNLDIWIWSREDDRAWRIVESPSAIAPDDCVLATAFRYASFDGLEVPAFIYMPRGATGPVPAIINIHGGPEGQYRPGFNGLFQYFVSRGYAVIAPNVRGSTGYGKTYQSLDDVRKRMDSVRDLAALHAYLVARGDIAPDKIALVGGSYGGYMVLAGLAFFPELWAVGVSIVGISNLVTFLENTAGYRRALREAEYGSLAYDREFLESVSPLNYVDAIKAPLFIIHGANDPRVPLSEAEQMHAALAVQGIPSQLLVYQDEGHGIAKLKNRLDAYPKVADFLDAHLRERV